MKKAIGICSIITGSILIGKEILFKIMMNKAINTIGGASGPTAVFVAGKIGWPRYSGLVVGVLLLVIGIVLGFWKRKSRGGY